MDVTLVSTDVEGSTELWEWVRTLVCHACQMLVLHILTYACVTSVLCMHVLRTLVLHMCYRCLRIATHLIACCWFMWTSA